MWKTFENRTICLILLATGGHQGEFLRAGLLRTRDDSDMTTLLTPSQGIPERSCC